MLKLAYTLKLILFYYYQNRFSPVLTINQICHIPALDCKSKFNNWSNKHNEFEYTCI